MKSLVFHNGGWADGDTPLLTAMSHAVWLSSIVFDGARAFEGVTPDLDLHCERTIASCEAFAMVPNIRVDEMIEIAREGVQKFSNGSELYIRPMFWAKEGWISPDPNSTQFAMLVYELPLPPASGFAACLSTRRRPAMDQATTDAKASCLYPNAARAMREAGEKGFDNAVVLDPNGNVAEFATSNLFIVKDGRAFTPIPNGTFLNGITRQRVISLLRERKIAVFEQSLSVNNLLNADEMFSTGNHGKVVPVIKYESRNMEPGPIGQLARELYWDYAHGS